MISIRNPQDAFDFTNGLLEREGLHSGGMTPYIAVNRAQNESHIFRGE